MSIAAHCAVRIKSDIGKEAGSGQKWTQIRYKMDRIRSKIKTDPVKNEPDPVNMDRVRNSHQRNLSHFYIKTF